MNKNKGNTLQSQLQSLDDELLKSFDNFNLDAIICDKLPIFAQRKTQQGQIQMFTKQNKKGQTDLAQIYKKGNFPKAADTLNDNSSTTKQVSKNKQNIKIIQNQDEKTTKHKSHKRQTHEKAFYEIQLNEDRMADQNQEPLVPEVNQFASHHNKTNQPKKQYKNESDPYKLIQSHSNHSNQMSSSSLNYYEEVRTLQTIILQTLKQKENEVASLFKQVETQMSEKLHHFNLNRQLQKQLREQKRQRKTRDSIEPNQIVQRLSLNQNILSLKPKNVQQMKLQFECEHLLQELNKVSADHDEVRQRHKQLLKEQALLRQNLKIALKARKQHVKGLTNKGHTQFTCNNHSKGFQLNQVLQNKKPHSQNKDPYSIYQQPRKGFNNSNGIKASLLNMHYLKQMSQQLLPQQSKLLYQLKEDLNILKLKVDSEIEKTHSSANHKQRKKAISFRK